MAAPSSLAHVYSNRRNWIKSHTIKTFELPYNPIPFKVDWQEITAVDFANCVNLYLFHELV